MLVFVHRRYLTNELGDIHSVEIDGRRTPIDPAAWGWVNAGGKHDHGDRRTVDGVRTLPGFSVTEDSIRPIEPGPRLRGSTWGNFVDGAAPPAAVRSRDGNGTLGYRNRLSEALGSVARSLPARPDRSPMLVYDFVGGRTFRINYEPPPPSPDGSGTVYVLEDGFGIKIGFTNGPVAKRISQLQTGNSRPITTIAEIGAATPDLEERIHAALEEWNTSGEWFARAPLMSQMADAGGATGWLQHLAGDVDFPVTVHPPYL